MTAQVGEIDRQGQGERFQRIVRALLGQRLQRRLSDQVMRIAQGLAQHRQHRFPLDGRLLGQHGEASDAVAPHPLVIVGTLAHRGLPISPA